MTTNLLLNLKQLLKIAATGSALAALTACGGPDVCSTQDGVTVCGTFGTRGYVANVQAQGLTWPPVAVSDGRLLVAGRTDLVEIAPDGRTASLVQAPGVVAVPSTDTAGGVYVVSGKDATTTLQAYDSTTRTLRWTAQLAGSPVGTPAAIAGQDVFVATNDGGSGATIWRIKASDGSTASLHSGASPAVVAADGSVRYLSTPNGRDSLAQVPMFSTLVAESAEGKELWRYTEDAGIVDLSPGANGETYLVTGTASGKDSHVLRRINANGLVAWSFHPDCGDCTVAAAPTVGTDTVYFPVWESRQSKPIDPLYAIDAATGTTRWTFDGFDNVNVSVSGMKMMIPGAQNMVDKTTTTHHPAGRPVVAQDGTLYVASDGAVVALDKNGQLLGFAQYDAAAGEVKSNDFLTLGKWVNPGVRPSPVLGPDGTLYVSDGATVRSFHTGRAASHSAWIAPYGGPDNSSRAPGM
jgi:outer membrane protein assembly factor BamB